MTGTQLILRERARQLIDEGWTAEHDDAHKEAELTAAARAYMWAAYCEVAFGADATDLRLVPNDWPKEWAREWWKPSPDPIRNLVKAGALIAAEIDRLQRVSASKEEE